MSIQVQNELQAPPQSPPLPNSRMWVYGLRWVLFLALGLVGFHESILRSLLYMQSGSANYSLTAVLMGAVLLFGIDRRRTRELPIHDREVDFIIGLIALAFALTMQGQLVPRFSDWFPMLRLDILAGLIWVFGSSALLFGTRSTLRFAPAWAVLMLFNAPMHLIFSLIFGGGWFGGAMASVSFVAVAAAVSTGGKSWRRVVVAILVMILGGLITLIMRALWTDPLPHLTQLPALGAVLSGAALRFRPSRPPTLLRFRYPTVKRARWAVVIVAVSAVILAFIPLPDNSVTRFVAGPAGESRAGVAVPTGWSEQGRRDYPWADNFFGRDATLVRQNLTAENYVEKWDSDGYPREVMVDTVRANNSYLYRLFTDETLYSTINGRRSESLNVDLGRDVIGQVYTVLDEDNFLTFTRLNFTWTREDGVIKYISVVAVDDHRPDADFPQLTPSLRKLVLQLATILLRGNAVTVDEATQFKDLDLVSVVGRGIIEEAWREHEHE